MAPILFKLLRDVAIKLALSARDIAADGVFTAAPLLKLELGCGKRGADISTYAKYLNFNAQAPGTIKYRN